VIDGKNIWPVITGADGAKSPHEAIYYLSGRTVKGVRMGDWKYLTVGAKDVSPEDELTPEELKLSRKERKALIKERTKTEGDIGMLFNLREDIGEQTNLITKQPEVAARLKRQLTEFEAQFKKSTRPAGTAE